MSQKIVFMGTPSFSVPILESLRNSNHTILHVYSQPPKKANRGQKIKISPVETFARKYSLSIRTPKNLNTEEEFNFLNQLKPDIVIVVAYGKIIPKKFLKIAKNGFINIHASLLPKWRGAAPIQRSIMNLDIETGISIMKIVEKLDAGPVMHQEKISINENTNALNLSEELSNLGAKSITDIINKIENGKAIFLEQNHDQATYAKKIDKKEGEIDWNDEAKIILGKINGLNPNPGAWFNYKGERYKIWKAKVVDAQGKVGTIIDNSFTVACHKQSIKILEIQKEGKTRQKTEDFLLGNNVKKGEKTI